MITPTKASGSDSERGARGSRKKKEDSAESAAIKPGESGKIKVLVVDDSALIRRGLTLLLGEADDILVVGAAKDGVEAEDLIQELRPDVITLDIEMPRMTGLELLGRMSEYRHRPAVVMVSSATKAHAPQTVRALELGASDYIFKQADASANTLMQIKDTLIGKVRAVWRQRGADVQCRAPAANFGGSLPRTIRAQRVDLVVLGASAGGPATLAGVFQRLRDLLGGVPTAKLQAGLLVVQHMPAAFTEPMAERFAELSGLPVRVAVAGDLLDCGVCLVAPGGRNLFVTDKREIELSRTSSQPGEYPKIDLALVTAAEVYGTHLCGIVMTGMGRDGAEGLGQVRKLKGITFIQEPATCVVDGMPSAALHARAAEVRLTPDQIAQVVAQILLHARVPSLENLAKYGSVDSGDENRSP